MIRLKNVSQLLFVVCFFIFAKASAEITSYRLELSPNLETKIVQGRAEINFSIHETFNFKVDSLIVENINLNGKNLPFKVENKQVAIDLKNQKTKSKLVITYHTISNSGLAFGNNYIYSNFSTCDWMPCSEASDEKFPF